MARHQATRTSATSRQSHLGWQPSRFLADRTEAKRAFVLAEQLGSVSTAAAELGTTWPVAAQGLHPPRARQAGPQPRGGQPAHQLRHQLPRWPASRATA